MASQMVRHVPENPSATMIVEHFTVLTLPIKFMFRGLRPWLKRQRSTEIQTHAKVEKPKKKDQTNSLMNLTVTILKVGPERT